MLDAHTITDLCTSLSALGTNPLGSLSKGELSTSTTMLITMTSKPEPLASTAGLSLQERRGEWAPSVDSADSVLNSHNVCLALTYCLLPSLSTLGSYPLGTTGCV
jgi:hypothetical protein